MGLFKAMTTKDTFTENGMPTNSTSSNPVLDLFFKMGGWTNTTSENEILDAFTRAYSFDRLLTTKCLFYSRDIRGGQGRRRAFRIMLKWVCINDPRIVVENIENIPLYGRWDDILVALGTPVDGHAVALILFYLQKGDKLCAKWMPRENKAGHDIAKLLMGKWGLSPRSYRKLLAGNTEVVENLMCANEWSGIDYNHIPSVAINKHRKSFYRHDCDRFSEWIASLEKPESGNKIHADAIYPHDIVKRIGIYGEGNSVLEAQWKALPNYVSEGRKILPVCDVSGSMMGEPLEVCVSLGLYLSERNSGPFKDGFVTFSGHPTLQILSGNLASRIRQLETSKWEMNTNLEAVFNLILTKAVSVRLPEKDMPTEILILSDMQFDRCVSHPRASAMDMIESMYAEAGYRRPNVIFWNLRTSSGVPVKYDESGVALVSGFSPSIMKSLLGGNLTPIKMMMNVLGSERYSRIK
jgi:hypothetical protein